MAKLIHKKHSKPNSNPIPDQISSQMPNADRQNQGGNPFQGDDPFEGAFTNMDFHSNSKDFIEPGDKTDKLLMRTVFKQSEPADHRLCVRLLNRFDKTNDVAHGKMLLNLLASQPSIGGRSRLELLMNNTNILATGVLDKFMGGNGHNKKEKPEVYINNKKQKDDDTE